VEKYVSDIAKVSFTGLQRMGDSALLPFDIGKTIADKNNLGRCALRNKNDLPFKTWQSIFLKQPVITNPLLSYMR
jgi:hypothetical protein